LKYLNISSSFAYYLLLASIFTVTAFGQQLSPDPLQITWVMTIGEKGDQPGQFMLPGGITADAKGNIYVADTGNNRLQKFDSTGKLLAITGGFGWDND